jgi:SAM-dependent methyltransferase
MGDHLARYLFAVQYTKGKSVLDAGTGPGYGAYLLKMAGAACVQAIDNDAPTINKARDIYKTEGLRFFVDDCEHLHQVVKPVDIICSFENIEHLQSPHNFLQSAAAALADNGLLLCSTPDRRATSPFQNGKPSNPFHVNEWYRDEFVELLRQSFEVVEIRAQVEKFGHKARRAAIVALCQEFHYNPAFRIPRIVARLFGRRKSEANLAIVQGLAGASDLDYPILEESMAPVIGVPFCHVALCRHPKCK